MRKQLISAVLGLSFVGVPMLTGCDSKVSEEKTVKTLKIGDKAPRLKDVEWKNGTAIAFEPGHVYVLDFWAIWCGPCIAMMPHLSDLQHEYREKNLHVIPVTTLDQKAGRAWRASSPNAGRSSG